MTRNEIWVWFAAGALSQFQSASVAANVADGLLEEFEARFEKHQGAPQPDGGFETYWTRRESHRAWIYLRK